MNTSQLKCVFLRCREKELFVVYTYVKVDKEIPLQLFSLHGFVFKIFFRSVSIVMGSNFIIKQHPNTAV